MCFFDVFFRRGARFSVTRLQKVKEVEGKGGVDFLCAGVAGWAVGMIGSTSFVAVVRGHVGTGLARSRMAHVHDIVWARQRRSRARSRLSARMIPLRALLLSPAMSSCDDTVANTSGVW